MLYLLLKTLVFYSKHKNEDKKYLKKKIQLKYKKLLVYLKIYNHIKNIAAENIS